VSAAVGEVLSTDNKAVIVATDTVITVTNNNITTDTIASKINEEHRLARQSAETAVQHATRCGLLLIEQKLVMKHGEFQAWIEKNCEFSYRSAALYMKAATQKCNGLQFSSLRSVLEQPRKALPSMSAPSARLSRKDLVDLRLYAGLRAHGQALEDANNAVKKAERALRRAKNEARKQRASARAALDAFREQQAKVTPLAKAAT
jgi:hypothetical protein